MLFEHGFKHLNTSNKPQVIYMTLYAKSAADYREHFADSFVQRNVAHNYDVVKTL